MADIQMTPEESLKAAKALAMLQEGMEAVRMSDGSWGVNVLCCDAASDELCGRMRSARLAGSIKYNYPAAPDALAAAYDALHPGQQPPFVVVKAVPPGFFWIMGNTLYLKGSQSGRTQDGDGYLVFMGGAEILHDLKPLFGEVRPR